MDFLNKEISPKDYELRKDLVKDIINGCAYNEKILDYMIKYKNDSKKGREISLSGIGNFSKCNKYWLVDTYKDSMIKDLKSTNLCHSKFCNNCKKVKQASRMSRYIPHIEPYADYNYHLVLTIPSVEASDLRDSILNMNKCFKYLIRYLNSTKLLSIYDFSKLGYLGAIRSLEITFKDNLYHPHFHVLLTLKSGGEIQNKKVENTYSFSKSNGHRLFSDFEILIQKIWYLLINNISVTSYNINNLDLGYSVICDKFSNNDYAELFKYLTKDFDETKNILTYDNFKALYENTYQLKQIQGYGIYYRIIDEDLSEEVDKEYARVVDYLHQLEEPTEEVERAIDFINAPYTLISRRTIYNIMNNS